MAVLTENTKSKNKVFTNPSCQPLEELTVTYIKDSTVVCSSPAIDPVWIEKRPFLQYINPPGKGIHGEFVLGAKDDWLERVGYIMNDLEWLLNLYSFRFWSQVIYERKSLIGFYTYLARRTPFFLKSPCPSDEDEEINKSLGKLERLVFNIFIRLTTCKASETEWMREETLGKFLYDNFLVSVPLLTNIAVLYGRDNHAVITEAVHNVFHYQERYLDDVKKAVTFLAQVLNCIGEELNCSRVGGEKPVKLSQRPTSHNTLNVQTLSKIVKSLLDTVYSITCLIDVNKQVAQICHLQHFEIRVADFYENFVPTLCRQVELVCNKEETFDIYCDLKFKMDLARRELISIVYLVLSSCINSMLQFRQELGEADIKHLAHDYTNVLSECLADRVFMRDYQLLYPVQQDLDVLSQLCPDIDNCDFIIESVISCLNDKECEVKPKPKVVPKDKVEHGHASTSYESQDGACAVIHVKKVTGVELESLITEVKDILPHLGGGFVQKCLDHYRYDSAAVINAVLESSLPDVLLELDPSMPYVPLPQESNGLPERHNVFDNDEFDIMNRDDVDVSNMHIGKRRSKHKNLNQLLDDKSHVNQMRDMYTKLSLVESTEDNLYDDEYDDTYDEAGMAVGDEGETERRPFTIPRVLQRRMSLPEEPEEDDVPEETDDKEKPKFDYFVPNPEDVRAKAEQWRKDHYRGRGRGAAHRDVTGKPKGHGQDKEVTRNRENKTVYKSRSGNHNRRAMASRKRNQGMVPF